MNMNGQIVNTIFSDGSSQVELEVSDLPAGVYLIECKNAHGQNSSGNYSPLPAPYSLKKNKSH